MRTIIAGSRTLEEMEFVNDAVAASGFHITEVVSGMAGGIDLLGWNWAGAVGIPRTPMPADWRPHGKVDREAGYYRNVAMGNYVGKDGALIAVWDGESGGTRHMIQVARKIGMKVFVFIPPGYKTPIEP